MVQRQPRPSGNPLKGEFKFLNLPLGKPLLCRASPEVMILVTADREDAENARISKISGARFADYREVRPSRMAYFVSSAMERTLSFSMMR
jgi:hypothetical protein